MEGSKGPGPDASRKNSGDSGPVGEAIPVRIEEGPAGDGAPPRSGPVGEAIPVRIEEGPAGNGSPPRSGPLTPTPSSRASSPESSGSENRRRRRPCRPKRRLWNFS